MVKDHDSRGGARIARRLIIGYDGSPNARDALTLGRGLAGALDAEPVVATVLPSDDEPGPGGDLEAQAQENLEQLQLRARDLLGEVTCHALFDDSASDGLKTFAREIGALAVVAGASHRSAIGRLILGSVGSSLLTHPPCAVAIAPHEYGKSAAGPLRRILVATDGSPEGEHACTVAGALAKRLDCALAIASVVEPPPASYSMPLTEVDLETYQRSAEQAARQVIQRAATTLPAGLEHESLTPHGDAATALAQAAEGYDLILVGSRGHGSVHRALLGSVAQGLIAASPTPVLVVPGDAEPLRSD